MVADGATARERLNGERGMGQELTAVPVASSAGSGEAGWWRGGEDDLRRPEAKMVMLTAFQGFPRRVARWRGGQRRGGASELVGEARKRGWLRQR